MLGIDPGGVEVVQRDLPALAELVLIDCPDPDTTESAEEDPHEVAAAAAAAPHRPPGEAPPGTNLAALRRILPHCDVLLVTTTQQKYRSARVAEELAAAAAGDRLVFVQTHADEEEDIRTDWRQVLSSQYAPGHVFLVDSLAALADAEGGLAAARRDRRAGRPTHPPACRGRRRPPAAGEFPRPGRADLAKLPPAARRGGAAGRASVGGRGRAAGRSGRAVGRANPGRIAQQPALLGKPPPGRGGVALGPEPLRPGAADLSRAGRTGFRALLYRARSPAQLALWARVASARAWKENRRQRQADRGAQRAVAGCWDQTELRAAAIVLEGYAAEAEFPPQAASLETVAAEADRAGLAFVARVSGDLDALVARLAERHTGWFTRWRDELLLLAMLGVLVFRLGKNFFYDSWWAAKPEPAWGLGYYLTAAIWLVLWCAVLLWAFLRRLRRGLARQIDRLAEAWTGAAAAAGVFARLESDCRRSGQFRQELLLLQAHVAQLAGQLALPEADLGARTRRPSKPKPTGNRWEGVLHFIRGQSHFRRTKIGTVPLLLIRRSLPLQVPPVAAGGLGGNAVCFRSGGYLPLGSSFFGAGFSSASGRASRQGLWAW